jgi:hypothetical protein
MRQEIFGISRLYICCIFSLKSYQRLFFQNCYKYYYKAEYWFLEVDAVCCTLLSVSEYSLISWYSYPCLLFRQAIIATDGKHKKAIYFYNFNIFLKTKLSHKIRNFLVLLFKLNSFRRRFNYCTEQSCFLAKLFNNILRLEEFCLRLFPENERSVTDLSLEFNLLTFFFSTLIFRSVLFLHFYYHFPFLCITTDTKDVVDVTFALPLIISWSLRILLLGQRTHYVNEVVSVCFVQPISCMRLPQPHPAISVSLCLHRFADVRLQVADE